MIAEGNINTPEKVHKVMGMGVYSVVVGTAITRPQAITREICKGVGKMKQSSKQSGLRFYVSIDVGGTAIKYGI
mgnify:CR=1 FL=1